MIDLRLRGGLTKRIAREKEEKKRRIPKPENYELQERKKKKRKIAKPENYERENFNVLPVSKDLNTRTNSMTKDQ